LIVDLKSPGVEVHPIRMLAGEHHFSEVVFDEAFVPDDMLLGREGDGWRQVTSELALERSGPERFLSTFPLLKATLDRAPMGDASARTIGLLAARLWSLHRMSLGVAAIVDSGEEPTVGAALVKEAGTRLERDLIEAVRGLLDVEPSRDSVNAVERLMAQAILAAPGFTLRGGTSEILRGIIAARLTAES
jgi:alkylation response protein AidB-like acyl-CoA dehydrogenase